MRILIATDAWHPQVNGVVRTLTSLARSAAALGAEVQFVTPDGFPSVGVPTYPGLRIALPNRREIARRIEAASPDAIHIATEGPIGWAVRGYCHRHKLAFTTSYTTRFPEYIAARSIIPLALSYAVLRHFHAAAAMTMVATASLRQELSAKGFKKLGFWTRGVDTELFRPDDPAELDLPRPIFLTMGRVAVEKNLEAFLALNLPGSKVVIGDGPQRAALARALINHPKVLLLDEPLGALDAFTRMRMQDEVLRLWQARRTTMLLVTHDIDEAIYMSDRIMIMTPRPGRIERIISVELDRPRQRSSQDFLRLRSDILEYLHFAGSAKN